MTPIVRYEEPFHWWGSGWNNPEPLTIGDLLRDGTLDVATGAILWAVLARRESLAVIGGPSGVGKTTLLTALCGFLPPTTRRLYARGCFETFGFLDDPQNDPASSVLLINEISPHLPVYLWGPAVERMLEISQRGFCLLATAHGTSVIEFVASLTGPPLRIPAARVAAFRYVALLEPSSRSASGRRVSGVWRLQPLPRGVDVTCTHVAGESGEQRGEGLFDGDLHPDIAQAELRARRDLLARLRDGDSEQLAAEPVPGLRSERLLQGRSARDLP